MLGKAKQKAEAAAQKAKEEAEKAAAASMAGATAAAARASGAGAVGEAGPGEVKATLKRDYAPSFATAIVSHHDLPWGHSSDRDHAQLSPATPSF